MVLLVVACSGAPPTDTADGTTDPTDLVDDSGGKTKPGKAGGSARATDGSGTTGTTSPTGGGGGGNLPGVSGPGPGTGSGGGGVPEANLYKGAANTRGYTADEIRLCAHAGLTLASLFGNDINQLEKTYWRSVNDAGGVYGRDVSLEFVDDGYNPNNVPSAFAECQDFNPFFMIGGIGFDQTPAFRQIADENKELYIYGMSTEKGGLDDTYTFGAAPSVEHLGTLFGRAVMSKLKGKKLGILTVSSDGWKGGADTFTAEVKRLGYKQPLTAAANTRREIANNNDVLTSHVDALKRAGVEAVFLNINVLAWTRFVAEADTQSYYPTMVGFGFDLLTETVGETMQDFPTSWGLSPWVVYDPGTKHPWSAEYKRMKDAYAKYWNNNEPNDIDWIQWVSMKAFHQLLLDCGKGCTRNKIAGLLTHGYERTVSPNCAVDFGRGRIGGYLANLWKSVDSGNTQVWKQVATCATKF
jgi:ABC-type branched-subunit amino acid transport system substrate-binding protein